MLNRTFERINRFISAVGRHRSARHPCRRGQRGFDGGGVSAVVQPDAGRVRINVPRSAPIIGANRPGPSRSATERSMFDDGDTHAAEHDRMQQGRTLQHHLSFEGRHRSG